MLLAAAIKKDGGNLSASAINNAIGSITYKGVCGTLSRGRHHQLLHQITVVSFKNGQDQPDPGLATYQEPRGVQGQIKQFRRLSADSHEVGFGRPSRQASGAEVGRRH